jgi:DNA-binding transcriptional ArsR family regulator
MAVLVFEALADPTRRDLLDLLAVEERSAGDLAAEFPAVSRPAISRHLRVLRQAGLVRVRADAQRRVYRIDPTGLAEVEAWLASYRHVRSNALDQLEHHLTQPKE